MEDFRGRDMQSLFLCLILLLFFSPESTGRHSTKLRASRSSGERGWQPTPQECPSSTQECR